MGIKFILACAYLVLGILEITAVLIWKNLESKKRTVLKSSLTTRNTDVAGQINNRDMAKQGIMLITASLFIFIFQNKLSITVTGLIGFALVLLPPVFSIVATIFGGDSGSRKN
ncbi:MAG: hypothetical protein ACQES9_08990 [Myxococcota bacterium]